LDKIFSGKSSVSFLFWTFYFVQKNVQDSIPRISFPKRFQKTGSLHYAATHQKNRAKSHCLKKTSFLSPKLGRILVGFGCFLKSMVFLKNGGLKRCIMVRVAEKIAQNPKNKMDWQ
jgi:hypothetical protein